MKFDDIKNAKYIPGAQIFAERGMVTVPFPAGEGRTPGKYVSFFLAPGIFLHSVDIHSTTIPLFTSKWRGSIPLLKINYCSRGRCEVKLHNGEYTYVAGGEIAIDTGQTKESYYYPAGDYAGIELVVRMDQGWQDRFQILGQPLTAPQALVERCAGYEGPLIAAAGDAVARLAREIRDYISRGTDCRMMAVKVLDLLTADLSVRYTAKELAGRFGIGETSLKNYFRGVYGCGYARYQNEQRMKAAARLLADGDEKVVNIAGMVGYTSQAKFGVAFKTFYGVTPLEYRRTAKLLEYKEEAK